MALPRNLQKSIDEKIKEATSINTKRPFPLNIIYTYNPFGAGDLFSEIADIYLSKNIYKEAVKFYIESASAFVTAKDEIAKSYAAQSYNKAADVYSNPNYYIPEKAVECYNRSSELFSMQGNFSLAASRKTLAAEILIKEMDYEKAADLLGDVNDLYEKAKMPANKNLMLEKYFACLIKCKKYRAAGDVALEMGSERGRESFVNYFMMLAYFCFFVDGYDKEMANVVELMGNCEEKNIVQTLQTRQENQFDEEMNRYIKVSKLKEEVFDLLNDVKKMIAPEFDIL
ncbi:hypothetical protein GVAV_001335 [Gurleya vavrai]